jgi:hypothetical protein
MACLIMGRKRRAACAVDSFDPLRLPKTLVRAAALSTKDSFSFAAKLLRAILNP